jgi:hypothetical protein
MGTSTYPNGFENGLAIRDIFIDTRLNPKSNVYWVDSVNGSNGNKGTQKYPFATIDYAIGRCAANQGDKIYVAAGHVETSVAAGTVTCDVAGVTIIFMGDGSSRAYVNFTTLVSASVIISADNVTLLNPKFISGIDALTSPITITGANCHIVNGEWYDAPAKAATNCIVASTAATGLRIHGWKYYASTTGTQKATNIQLVAVSNAELFNIDISGDFSTGNINLPSAMPNLQLNGLKLKNTNVAPKPGMVIHASSTGMAKNIDIRIVSGATFVSSVAAMNWDANCLGYNADGEGGDNIGTADSSSIEGKVDAVKAVTDVLRTDVGTEFWIKKTLTSSAIVQAGIDVTGVSGTGELAIVGIVLKTDATGLATGTAFQLTDDNAKGSGIFAQELVANLGASTTVSSPSAVNKNTILEVGKKVIAKSTVADCTGGGTIDIYVKFQRLTAGATITAA